MSIKLVGASVSIMTSQV